MFYDYDFLMTSTIIITLMLCYYFRRYHLPVDRNRNFLKLLVMEVIVMALDILATWMDDFHLACSIQLLTVINLAFFLCFITRAYQFYHYTASFLPERKKRNVFMAGLLMAGWLYILPTVLFHHIFWMDAQGYHSGPFYNVIYLYNAIYFGMSLVLLLRYKMSKRERETLMAAQIILIVGSLIRYLLPKIPIMDFFCTLSLLTIYLGVQNPDLMLNDKTGLFNSLGFYYYAREQLHQGKKMKMMMLSIDHYEGMKAIYGNRKMSECLHMLGHEMITHFRKYVLAYQGGGRFFIATTGEFDASAFIHYFANRFSQPFVMNNGENIYLNYCISYLDDQVQLDSAKNLESVMSRANERAELSGSGTVVKVTNEDFQRHRHNLAVEDALNNAIYQNRIDVYYQPIYHTQTHTITGAEALARLNDPKLGFISPEEFISAAERMGLIHKLGAQVLEKVCQFIATHDLKTLGIQYINVNVSPLQCLDEHFPQLFKNILNAYHVPSAMIHLEITESTHIDMGLLKNIMGELSAMGVTFNLDDYGTGYSNISLISQYPFSTIKVDLSLTWSYFKGENTILPHIVKMIREMGKNVTVEGVETENMAKELKQMDVNDLQGYYFAKPLPPEAFLSYLKTSS